MMLFFIVIGLAAFIIGMVCLGLWSLRTGFREPKKKLPTPRQLAYKAAWYNEDHPRWGRYRWYELTAQARKDGFIDGL